MTVAVSPRVDVSHVGPRYGRVRSGGGFDDHRSLSVVETARLFLAFTAVTNAARSAARYAIVHGEDRTGSGFHGPSGPGNTIEVENVARNFLSLGTVDVTAATVNVTYPADDNDIGDPVEVAVSCPYSPLFGLLPLNTTLRNTSRGVIVF